MKILKYLIPENTQKAVVTIVGGTLSFDFGPEIDGPIYTVDLNEIISKHSQDHGCIAFGKKAGKLLILETTGNSKLHRSSPFDVPQNSARSDTPMSTYAEVGGVGRPIGYLLTPIKNCDLNDCTFYFFTDVAGLINITIDGRAIDSETEEMLPTLLNNWLPISLIGDGAVQQGQSVSFVIDAPVGADIFLEATAGALSHTRAVSGSVVTVMAARNQVGDVIRVKAGYRNWPGKAEKIFAVVA